MTDFSSFDTNHPMIQFEKLSFRYALLSDMVLENLTCNLYPGHIYGLLGVNGVGKSTMFRMIAGLNPPTSGTVNTLGCIPSKRLPSMLSELFLLPEEINFPNINIEQYGQKYGQFYPNYSHEKLLNYMELLFTTENNENGGILTKSLKSMSQGQRKKAITAFALACNTKILLMDEPTNGLDIPSKTAFRQILDSCRSENRCIIISTHQVRDLESLIDGVIIMSKQSRSIIFSTTAENILKTFHFGLIEPNSQPIYQQQGIGGQIYGLTMRTADMPVQDIKSMDLEILFNATMASSEAIKNALNVSL